MSLVGSVLTVVLLVAGPAHGDAATAGAGEEVNRALQFPLVWKRNPKTYLKVSLSSSTAGFPLPTGKIHIRHNSCEKCRLCSVLGVMEVQLCLAKEGRRRS